MIKLMGIHKQFGNDKVLEEVNLTLEDNGIYIIKGKSGCGKTTLLKMLFKRLYTECVSLD